MSSTGTSLSCLWSVFVEDVCVFFFFVAHVCILHLLTPQDAAQASASFNQLANIKPMYLCWNYSDTS